MYRALDNISCDLQGQGQIMYLLVNESPPKPFDVVTSNFVDA